MPPITQLIPAGVPGRRYGSFAGKTATAGGLTVDALIRQLRWQPVWLVTLADQHWVQEDFVQLDLVQRVAAGTERRFAGYDLDALADPYFGRLLDDPPLQITRETREAFFGVVTVAEGSFALANADGALTKYARENDLRGTVVTIERYDVVSGVFALTVQATVVHVELWPGRLVVHYATEDPSILETEIPRAIVDTARWPKAVDAGATIKVGAGVLKKAPLLYVTDNTLSDVYEYLLPYEVSGGAWTVDQLYRDGPGEGLFDTIGAGEYTVDTTTYAGLTVCRFTTRQTNFANGFHRLYADLTGPAVARNFVRVLRSVLNNTTWGLDRPVDATSFDAEETKLDPATGTAVTGLFCDGLLERPQAAQDVLRELCMVRGIRPGLSAAGAWTVTVDTERTSVALIAQDGPGDGPRTLIAAGPWGRPRVADQVSEFRLHYRRDLVTGESRSVQSREVHRGLGRPIEETSPWIRDHTTADKVVHYRAQRLIHNGATLPVTLTQEARALREGDLVRVTYPPLDLTDVDMEVARVTHDLAQVEATLAGWSDTIYDYVAGTLPSDAAPGSTGSPGAGVVHTDPAGGVTTSPVTTGDVAGEAITKIVSDSSTVSTDLSTTTTTLLTVSNVVIGSDESVVIQAVVQLNLIAASSRFVDVKLLRDSTVLLTMANLALIHSAAGTVVVAVPLAWTDAPVAGTYDYKVTALVSSGSAGDVDAINRALVVFLRKR